MWTIKAFGESPPVDIPQKLLAFVSLNGSGDQALNITELSSLVKTTDVEILSQTSNRTVVSAKANGLDVTIEYFGSNFGTSSAVITGFNGQSEDGKYLFEIDEIFFTADDTEKDPVEIEASWFTGDDLVLG